MKLKLKMFMKILVIIKKIFDFSNCSAKSKYCHDLNKFIVGKMKYETGGAAISKFFALKPKNCSFLVHDNSEHENADGVNKNFVATISHGEYKYALLNQKCLRHSMNRIQSKNHK